MEKITSLAKKLANDLAKQPGLAHLTLQQGEMFGWDHTACAISYQPNEPHAAAYLLHECGHALLGHAAYKRDIELIAMERAAWDEALVLAPRYGITVDEELVEDALDTYRDWLHARSLCPHCSATGVQTAAHVYSCLACHHKWQVNEARSCALRRYSKQA